MPLIEKIAATWVLMVAHPLYIPFAFLFSGLSNVLIAIPSLVGLYRWAGRKKALLIFFVLSAFALLFEGQAVITGWPYTSFLYTDLSGFKLFNLVPWTLPFSWVPLLLGSAFLSFRMVQKKWQRVVVIALILTAIDLAFDPLATKFGLWVWQSPGQFYGVPWQNFLGWFISGIIGGGIFVYLTRQMQNPMPRTIALSAQVLLLCCLILNLLVGFWMPALIAVALLLLYYRHGRHQTSSQFQ